MYIDNNEWISIELAQDEVFRFRPIIKNTTGVITEYFPREISNRNVKCFDSSNKEIIIQADFGSDKHNFIIEGEEEGVSQDDWIGIIIDAGDEDHYLGFGESFESYDQKGMEVDLWVTNGAFGKYRYKPIPFFLNPRGYGLSINLDRRSLCRLQCPDQKKSATLVSADEKFDFSLIVQDNLKKILKIYMESVGKPELPEEWVFGPWKSRDWQLENQESVHNDFHKQRNLGIAATVKLIDASWQSSYITFDFHKERFPFPEKMMAEAQKMGYKIILWVAPWMSLESESYEEMHRKGFLVKDKDGNPYVTRLGNDPGFVGTCFDFTNPSFIKYWKEKISKLMDIGVAGFKTDFGEQIDEDAVFYNGKSGREMHNIFPYLYNKATWDVVKERKGYLLGRSAWRFSQSIPGVWAGDQTSDFCRWSGLPSAITAGITAGLSGFGFWTSDIGGYFSSPDKETLLRWTQFGTFSPVMQLHGMGEHDPWKYDEETLVTYRKYSELRMRLLPYIYASAKEASNAGIPMMRGLALEYPRDSVLYENVANQYEYFFGEGILCCPICFGGTKRQVYLPEGDWCDWWSGEIYEGNKAYCIQAELTKTPLFLKKGAIIATYDQAMMTTEPVNGKKPSRPDLVFEIYPGVLGEFESSEGVKVAYNLEKDRIIVSLKGLSKGQKIGLKFRGEYKIIQCDTCEVLKIGSQKSLPAILLGGNFLMQRIDIEAQKDGDCTLILGYKE
ncbi:glycoside hydrolase family 31 protein [Clostridia bacterium]|nr:glycoside hydrolase family 31 protein [Clostridia bacterium]